MAIVVLGYPVVNKKEYNWIQDFRRKHDKLYFDVVEAHFTFVFPVMDLRERDLINHVQIIADQQKKISFRLAKAVINKDAFNDYWHSFLVPVEGYKEIVTLHDRLYTSILRPHLRSDIPFIPHVGLASDKSKQTIVKLTDELNKPGLSIEGSIRVLDIARYENDKVETLEKVKLI